MSRAQALLAFEPANACKPRLGRVHRTPSLLVAINSYQPTSWTVRGGSILAIASLSARMQLYHILNWRVSGSWMTFAYRLLSEFSQG